MKIKNEFKLTVDSKSVNESFCRVVVTAFASALDPTIEEITDLKTAVSEAVTNSIVHGYADTCGKIYITGQLLENDVIKIKIKDKGRGIADVSEAMTPLYTTGGSDRAGLGFTVMQSFCDRVSVTSSLGIGTTVVLTKKISGRTKW
ncbi:anti-sigma F factor [Eubacterium coprostanoligenes]|uniref:Anti-sigma F factor n=1 Tax=Eubacterium coprostanoligenes TaxID=290054 RepID=A0A1T4KVP3_9FIRM|nr:anti-sigma F factor [Eubacterium coprostanoligenes]MDD6666153.1 anti-sigma F factor [Eubacterium coprostanoligenes]MDD7357808.1 anti-sigma F factor [Eubacterium coprostanoligenes]MDY4698210.1 anti-sigma F factor [Eubacterium coprostanoligenes]MDY5377049.1 anti-sigma F factor [Eubacterium coprostanoligenes]MDY5400428.1 anti-sigma F factor [Eubacterium coprostanoligenes]